jgi:hypothetical protein
MAAQPPPPGTYARPQTNGKATASMVLGIVGIAAFPLIPSILGLVFGYMARGEIDRSGGAQEGRGMAIAGIVLGWVGIAIPILVAAIMIAVYSAIPHGG